MSSMKLPVANPEDIQKLLTERQVDVTMPWYEDMSPLPLSVPGLHFTAQVHSFCCHIDHPSQGL